MWAYQNHDRNKTLCPNRNLPEAELSAAFVRLYNKLKLNNDKILLPLLRQLQEVKNCHRKNDARLAEINQEMAELSRKILILNRIKAKGLLDETLYTAQSNETNHRLTELKTEKGRLLEADDDDAAVNGFHLLMVHTGLRPGLSGCVRPAWWSKLWCGRTGQSCLCCWADSGCPNEWNRL